MNTPFAGRMTQAVPHNPGPKAAKIAGIGVGSTAAFQKSPFSCVWRAHRRMKGGREGRVVGNTVLFCPFPLLPSDHQLRSWAAPIADARFVRVGRRRFEAHMPLRWRRSFTESSSKHSTGIE
jgi:hypothetical protein